jgi:hypothetical protein
MSPSTKKEKQLDKNTVLGFFVNFCAFFSLILIVGLLVMIDTFGTGRAGMASVSQTVQSQNQNEAQTCVPAASVVLFPTTSVEPSENPMVLSVNDAGFLANQIDMSRASVRAVKIVNRGAYVHSFAIDLLGVDSGPIESGKSATVALENIPEDVQALDFYSSASGDESGKFRGTIVVR